MALLRELDKWLDNTGFNDCHPWRLSILATLAQHGGCRNEQAAPIATNHRVPAELQRSVLQRANRMLALVDMAQALPQGDTPFPADGDSTDRDDQLSALLHSLNSELQALHSMAAPEAGQWRAATCEQSIQNAPEQRAECIRQAPTNHVDTLADSIASHAAGVLALIDDQDEMPHRLVLRTTVARMGWLADVLVQRMSPNNTAVRGGAGAWMLEGHEVDALEALNAQGAVA